MGLTLSASALAVQVNFTGGVVVRNSGPNETTDNVVSWDNVDYYEEGGFRLDFIGGESVAFTAHIGNYYGSGNDVIHGHWETGGLGGLTQIKVTKIDGTAFDLNYFVLTSNTDTGGSVASGNEQARIHASLDGTTSSHSQLLPPEDWGFPGTQVLLGTEFDGIKAFWLVAENDIDCFGMDSFFIDEAPPITLTPTLMGSPTATPTVTATSTPSATPSSTPTTTTAPPAGTPPSIPTLSGWAASLLAGLLALMGWRAARRNG